MSSSLFDKTTELKYEQHPSSLRFTLHLCKKAKTFHEVWGFHATFLFLFCSRCREYYKSSI
uniref:Uncharacterized protein n=1 Tax=Anguilla anguilla TaxID=7936 RepID=A0A0E9XCQ1_ANGAN